MKKIKTKKMKLVNEKTLLVAVDIGKIRNTAYCQCPDGTDWKPFEFANNHFGFTMFWNRVSRIKKLKHLTELVIGYESTGCYAEPLIHYVREKEGVRVVQVNPMHTKRVKDLHGNSPSKTDRKDPKVIADIIKLGHALTVVIPEGAAANLRRLTHARERAMQRHTALLNQLQDLIFLIFPEFFQIMKKRRSKSAQYLLKHYPTPQDITEVGVKGLACILKKTSHGVLREKRAQALYEAAQNSVGIQEGREAILLEIKEILSLLDSCDRFVALLEKEMSDHLKEIPYSQYILSLKGMGEITTAGIIGEVGDFTKFHTLSEIEKLAGLDLYEISSGKHRGSRRISKRGRPLLRKLLYFAAMHAISKGGVLHEKYHRFLERGTIKMKALIAMTRNLLRIIFALVRHHKRYDMGYIKTQKAILQEVA